MGDSTLISSDISSEEQSFFMRQEQVKVEQHQARKLNLEKLLPPSQIPCKQCHKRTVVYHHQQRRAADEGMDAELHCNSCGFNWRWRA